MTSCPNEIITNFKLTRATLFGLLGLFLVSLVMRLVILFDYDLIFDEVVLLLRLDLNYVEIWNVCKDDNYPPLFLWILKTLSYVNTSEHWYRFWGAVMGASVAPTAFFLGRRLINQRFGWILGIVACLSVPLILFTSYLRMFNIQPTLTCLSLTLFFRALDTNARRDWFLLNIVNVIGFYFYIFFLILVAAEFILVLIRYRLHWQKYIPIILPTLCFLALILLWILPVLARYSEIQGEGFWTEEVGYVTALKIAGFLHIGYGFPFQPHIALLISLPFAIGFLLAILHFRSNFKLLSAASVFSFVILILALTDLFGPSFLSTPYIVFIVPLYLSVSLAGWYLLSQKKFLLLGFSLMSISTFFALHNYYFNTTYHRSNWGYVRIPPDAEPNEGHVLTMLLAQLDEHIQKDEAIIHYANEFMRIRTFFPSIYYHQRRYPEYIYSHKPLPQYNGAQYLRPGDWIHSIRELDTLPPAIWVVTSILPEAFYDEDVQAGRKRPFYISEDNLPAELKEVGYLPDEQIRVGMLTAWRFRKSATP